MAEYRKATVIVRRAGVAYETVANRPVRRRPDGRSGVVYAGDVYAMHCAPAGDFIDLDEVGTPKGQCPTFVSVDEPLVYVTDQGRTQGSSLVLDRWAIETNKYGHYLVFDATEELAEDVVDRLAHAGIDVRRWDVSHRRAADGYFYDWFARLDFEGTNEECELAVSEALEDESDAGLADLAVRLAELEARSQHAQETLETVVLQALEVRDAALQEKADAEKARTAAEKAARALDRRLRAVEGDLAATSAERDELRRQERASGADDAVARLGAQLAEAVSRVAEKEHEVAELSEISGLIEQENAALTAEVDRLREALDEARERELRASTRAPRTSTVAREDPLRRRAWRRLVLDESALESLHDPMKFRRLDDLIGTLHKLDTGQVGSKRWDGKCIHEVDDHVSTGVKEAPDLGRIYYAKREDKLLVFIDRKEDDNQQKRFVSRIDKQALTAEIE